MTSVGTAGLRPIIWAENTVKLIDQTRLPLEEVWLEIGDYRQVIDAIKTMRIRGAPAIGVAGAYAVALAAIEFARNPGAEFRDSLRDASAEIAAARPTGANLGWAVERMMAVLTQHTEPHQAVRALIDEAETIHKNDIEANLAMGAFGAELIAPGSAVLTHCNAGALATGGYGTALGVIYSAWDQGKIVRVYADETRPFLQGARLTAWELGKANVETTLIPDSAAGQLMRHGKIQAVIVGADRIAANGDVANKIGTYSIAVIARENSVPFYVAAPTGTVDLTLESGDSIVIEERPPEEVTHLGGTRIAPEGIDVLNTAFDVTPNRYVTAIITEQGVITAPFGPGLRTAVEAAGA